MLNAEGVAIVSTPQAFAARQDQLGAVASGADAAIGATAATVGRLVEETYRGVDLRDVDQHFRQQADARERGAVLPQGHLVLRAPVEEVEDRARQAPLRETSQIRDIHRPGEVGHNCGSLYL
jgi:hypothetical protein